MLLSVLLFISWRRSFIIQWHGALKRNTGRPKQSLIIFYPFLHEEKNGSFSKNGFLLSLFCPTCRSDPSIVLSTNYSLHYEIDSRSRKPSYGIFYAFPPCGCHLLICFSSALPNPRRTRHTTVF